MLSMTPANPGRPNGHPACESIGILRSFPGALFLMARKKKAGDCKIVLPQRLQGPEVAAVLQSARAVRNEALVVDASALTHVGVLGIQLLLSIAKTWRHDGSVLQFTGATGELRIILETLGIAASGLGIDGEAP